MILFLLLIFVLVLSGQSLWLFALSAHVAPLMETVAPVFWVVSLASLCVTYARGRSLLRQKAIRRILIVGLCLISVGVIIGMLAISF